MLNNNQINITRFQIIEQIDIGSFGEVFLIKELDSNQPYAAKIINNFPDLEDFKQVISNEIEHISSLNHPALIKFIGYSPHNFQNLPYPTIITEFGVNGSLRNILNLESNGRSPQKWDFTHKLINIYGIASGMQYLHSNNITHRYLSPENILMDENYFPKISDFGLLKSLNLVVNPAYMSPESIDHDEYSCASDVYSFSILIYEILTFSSPYSNLNGTEEIFSKVASGYRPELTPDIPTFFQNLISRCWSQIPLKRPTFSEIVNILKSDTSFITDLVDESEYFAYVDKISSTAQPSNQNESSPASNDDIFKKYEVSHTDFRRLSRMFRTHAHGYYAVQRSTGLNCFCKATMYNVTKEQNKKFFYMDLDVLIKCKHPAIVPLVGFSIVKRKGEMYYLKMEAGSLRDVLENSRDPLFDDTRKLIISYGVACAMEYLHSKCIINSNLSSSHVLLDSELHPHLSDFFVSYRSDEILSYDHEPQRTSIVYMAPEFLMDPYMYKNTFQIDVYSYAMVLYELWTEMNLFDYYYPLNLKCLEYAINGKRPAFPEDKCLPERIIELIGSCWKQEPDERPTFSEICDYIETIAVMISSVDANLFFTYKELVRQY